MSCAWASHHCACSAGTRLGLVEACGEANCNGSSAMEVRRDSKLGMTSCALQCCMLPASVTGG